MEFYLFLPLFALGDVNPKMIYLKLFFCVNAKTDNLEQVLKLT